MLERQIILLKQLQALQRLAVPQIFLYFADSARPRNLQGQIR